MIFDLEKGLVGEAKVRDRITTQQEAESTLKSVELFEILSESAILPAESLAQKEFWKS